MINDARRAVEASAELRFPVLIKPNIGGSGAGIRSFANADALAEAAGSLDLGLDGTALVQERLRPEADAIVRVEILNGELLYAIRIRLMPGSFNLCPADYCDLTGLADPIEAYEPPDDVVDDVKRIVAAADMDIAGVEYLVDARDGRPTFYDVNALSNFVANAPQIVGFDPFVTFVDALVERAGFAASIAAA